MDIQRPNTTPPSPQPLDRKPTVFTPNGQQTRPATMEYTRPRPDTTQPTYSQTPSPEQQAPVSKPKKSKKGLVFGVFMLLFVGLIGTGTYYYLAIYKKPAVVAPQPAPETKQPESADSTSVQATPEGVDKTTQDIDQQLNSQNDTQDFAPNDVNDSSLGL